MKRSIPGAIVGGLLIFVWQMLSWTMLDLHRASQDHSPKQDSIMAVLNGTLTEGGYLMPSVPKGASMDEMQKLAAKSMGKPWASIQYHQSFNSDNNQMFMNMGQGLVTTIIMVWLLCWILSKSGRTGFGNVFLACIFTGLIVFINEPYTNYIWYKIFDIKAHLIDALASWGLCGLWLGWWLNRK
jgi:xanthine/uracil permease